MTALACRLVWLHQVGDDVVRRTDAACIYRLPAGGKALGVATLLGRNRTGERTLRYRYLAGVWRSDILFHY